MNNYPYRVNVGFLINAPVGTYREFSFDQPAMELADDLHADDIHCTVRASRVQQGILAEADCSCKTELECIRCLEPFEAELNAHFEELFYFHWLRESKDAEEFLPENGYLDLGEIIREYLVMSLYADLQRGLQRALSGMWGESEFSSAYPSGIGRIKERYLCQRQK